MARKLLQSLYLSVCHPLIHTCQWLPDCSKLHSFMQLNNYDNFVFTMHVNTHALWIVFFHAFSPILLHFFSSGNQQSQDFVLLCSLSQPKYGQSYNWMVLLHLQLNKWGTLSQSGCQHTACGSMQAWSMWLEYIAQAVCRMLEVSSGLCKCLPCTQFPFQLATQHHLTT